MMFSKKNNRNGKVFSLAPGLVSGSVLLLLTLFFQKNIAAQSASDRRFKAAAVAGITASQIDGDALAGYDKLGLTAGIQAFIVLGKKWDASVGLHFSQRGSQEELIRGSAPSTFGLTLNYVEVPLQIHLGDWRSGDEEDDYYRLWFSGGLSYGRLIGFKLKDEGGAVSEIRDEINSNDFSFLFGVTYMTSPKFGVNFRYNRSLNYIWDPRKHMKPIFRYAWNGHFLSFNAQYNF